MPKFDVTIIKTVPSYRERAVITVEAASFDDIRNNLGLPDDLLELEDDDCIQWEEIMEGHGGFPCDYEIQDIDKIEDDADVDIVLGEKDE